MNKIEREKRIKEVRKQFFADGKEVNHIAHLQKVDPSTIRRWLWPDGKISTCTDGKESA